MSGPFRETSHLLACPRCGENLEVLTSGVRVCGRCEGVWLPTTTVEAGFGSPFWPRGASAWWRRELECPVCGTSMTPITAGDVVIDRCGTHGEWLDAGELGRLLQAPQSIELEALYERIKPDGELPARLLEFRKLREAERARRTAELDAYREKLEAEQLRLRQAEEDARRKEQVRLAEAAAEERRAQLLALRTALQAQHAAAETAAGRLERVVLEQRDKLRSDEGALADARGRLLELERRLVEVDRDIRSQ